MIDLKEICLCGVAAFALSGAPALAQVQIEGVAGVDAAAVDVAEAVVESADVAETVIDAVEVEGVDEIIGSSDGSLISLNLDKAELGQAISVIAQLAEVNIIIPELLDSSPVTVNLTRVEWQPALQSILDTYNYELYQRVSGSGVYCIRLRPEGAPEPQVVETFALEFATVPNAAKLIRELLPNGATISEFASRNMLVVKSSESSLAEIRAVLKSIDKVRKQVFIESKFMELTDDAQKDLGVDWSVFEGYSFGTDGASTYDYSREDTDTRTSTRTLDTLAGDSFSLSDVSSKATTEAVTSVLSADEFRVMLSALEQNKGVNIVSNPKIIVANEEKANISIIRKEPNLKQDRQQSSTDSALDNITYELDEDLPFFDFGIKLDVTPSINTADNISIKIEPSLTRKYADKQAGENTYPIIDEKSITTVFSLASGQTAAIGGLTEVTESEEEKSVPVLGSIPFLGRLFSWTQTVHGQDETIIFVTVGLADTEVITMETGLPEDSELARRQMIREANDRRLRDSDRGNYQAEESDKLDDMLEVIKNKEELRVERRDSLQEAKVMRPSSDEEASLL